MLSRSIPWNIPCVTSILCIRVHEPLAECVYLENTSGKWDIPWYTTRKWCTITILYHTIENTEAKTLLNFGRNKIGAHHGKVGYNTVENTIVFLNSDWLYFLWHGIKRYKYYTSLYKLIYNNIDAGGGGGGGSRMTLR